MKYEDIEPYLIDFVKGNLDEDLEYRIRAYLNANPDFQKEIDELKDTLEFVQESPLIEPEPGLKMEFYAMLNAYQVSPPTEKTPVWTYILDVFQSRKTLTWGSFILVIFLAGYFTSNIIHQPGTDQSESALSANQAQEKPSASQAPYSEKKYQDQDLSAENSADEGEEYTLSSEDSKEPLAISEIEALDNEIPASGGISDELIAFEQRARSGEDISRDQLIKNDLNSDERIQNIYTSMKSVNQDEVIIQALIRALNTDPNPNVRIAAIEALEKFAGQNQVKHIIARSLDNQSSATVQLATIDLIVKYQIKEGASSLKKLLVQPGINQTVKQQAEIALELIS
ncbi:MAG: HEAT repeat domain-containing protein [Microscillaceae bacterium]|nr:HEAT repeat domain-containing protein [Microscillaceae bacterium]